MNLPSHLMPPSEDRVREIFREEWQRVGAELAAVYAASAPAAPECEHDNEAAV